MYAAFLIFFTALQHIISFISQNKRMGLLSRLLCPVKLCLVNVGSYHRFINSETSPSCLLFFQTHLSTASCVAPAAPLFSSTKVSKDTLQFGWLLYPAVWTEEPLEQWAPNKDKPMG